MPPPSPSSSIPQLRILRAYAKLDDASLLTTLPPTVYFSHTRHTLTIFDAYPKALFHFLVLPRLKTLPTSRPSSPSSSRRTPASDGDGRDEDVKVMPVADDSVCSSSTTDLTSLRTLLQRATVATDTDPDAGARVKGTISVLSDEATRLQSQIEREMQARYDGFKWPIWIGFHAIPSME
jgi:aprataxin